jgi:hypothetical protein
MFMMNVYEVVGIVKGPWATDVAVNVSYELFSNQEDAEAYVEILKKLAFLTTTDYLKSVKIVKRKIKTAFIPCETELPRQFTDQELIDKLWTGILFDYSASICFYYRTGTTPIQLAEAWARENYSELAFPFDLPTPSPELYKKFTDSMDERTERERNGWIKATKVKEC